MLVDVFAIMEINLTNEQLKFPPFPGYMTYLLPKFRQVASGILVRIKRGLTIDFEGAQDLNAAGQELEDILNSTPLELIYHASDPHTFLHYNGTCSTPDLLCVSSDIGISSKRGIIEDPGSGHRQVIAHININDHSPMAQNNYQKVSWNFKKANWKKFTELLDRKLRGRNWILIVTLISLYAK
ncbi:hypothetical protein NPIL_101211 [Nephila pilipes]|uniref:Uncharacterized protein n=1 Tax=Nephila pilipes TaxID=299642 RepID=A0A8X6NPV5_NEPPI|nr:hypothetical protein NPIL_101211 [Nephila pilipes]